MAEVNAQSRYRVIERVATGGMAEVFHAEAHGLADFTKSVAIKRVLPHLAHSETFLRMFLDEARLSARLNHRNIVQVFDVGRIDDAYFLVMEYVDGITLRRLMDHLRRRGEPVPVPVAVHIAIEVCNGLHYAHRLRDRHGRALQVVHRDVSPGNVLVSRHGGVKLVDFGLAKARSQLEKTDPGVLKGKFSYLAPESLDGGEVDALADQFAVGIVLWEALAGRRLFAGENDWATTEAIRRCEVPALTTINPAVPAALDAIVRRALAREKNARFASTGALSRALTESLFAHRLAVGAEDVAILVHEVLDVRYTAPSAADAVAASPADPLIDAQLAHMTSLGTPASVPPPAVPLEAVAEPTRPRSRVVLASAVLGGSLIVASTIQTLGARVRGSAVRLPSPVAATPGPLPRSPIGSVAATVVAPLVVAQGPASTAARAPSASGPLPDVPSFAARLALGRRIEAGVRACEGTDPERHGRHARLDVTYEGPSGDVVDARVRGDYFPVHPIGACLVQAARAVAAPRFRQPRWRTDYQFMIR